MKNFYLGLKFALSYFTIFPIEFKRGDNLSKDEVLNYMLLLLPLVGLILGVVTALIFTFISKLGIYGAVISAILYMMLYGFIHTEAVIDVYDAIYASHSNKDSYKIIKEPTVGAIGVLYGVSFLILKVVGVVILFTHNLLGEFIAVVIVSRISILTMIILHDFRSSFVSRLKESLDYWYLTPFFIIYTIIGSYITPIFIILLILGVIISSLISIFFAKKIGFVNGDVLGATLEGVEILLLLFIALISISD